MEIRRLTRADLDALEEFYHSLSEATAYLFRPFGEAEREKLERHLRETDEGRHASLGLVGEDGAIEGHTFVLWLQGDKPTFGLGLRDRMQGQGWGPKLMAAVMATPEVEALPLVTLTVIQANERARSLYEKMGFVVMGECQCWEPGDSWYMERRAPL
jgi:ribosomal protein S18 acetylase RimI-like enzyme